MIFWVASGLDQKSGAAICCSISSRRFFLAGMSKIAPHGFRLPAELGVRLAEVFQGHTFIVAALADGIVWYIL
jgi:hypothetical protein